LCPFPDHYAEEETRVCVFYSITSSRKGLSGIDLGNILIKSVLSQLQDNFKSLRVFVTLSPIPKFSQWLILQIAKRNHSEAMKSLREEELAAFIDSTGSKCNNGIDAFKLLLEGNWHLEIATQNVLKGPLMRLCLWYLINERNPVDRDPVCNFHMKNGAQIAQLNWMADLSSERLKQSFGIMVNYEYKSLLIEANRKNYLESGHIALSKQLSELPF